MHILINKNYLTYNKLKVRCAIGKKGIGKKQKEGDQITPRGTFRVKSILYRKDREKLAKTLLEDHNIPTANAYWPACHDQPAFKQYINSNTSYKNANDILDRHLALPMYFEMDLDQVDYVAETINSLI